MKRKILKATVAIILILTMIAAFTSCMGTARPAAESADGTIAGTEIHWSYNKDTKILAIEGSGAIPNFESSTAVPWFAVRQGVTNLVLGEGITAIGDYAFYYLPILEQVSLPGTITSLGKYSFAFCSALTSFTVPEGVTAIGDSCFEGCAALKTVFVPHTTTSIGQRAFLSCGALEDAIIMAQITEIKSATFKNCSALKTLCFHDAQKTLANIAADAFEGAAIGFGSAQFTASTTGKATLTIKYVYENGSEDAPTYTKEFVRGAEYSIDSPAIEGYTADNAKLTGTIVADTALTVTYKVNAPVEEAPAPEETPEAEKPEEKQPITVGTVIALVILGAVIVGIIVLAIFMMRADKKPAQNLKAKNAKPAPDAKKNSKK